MAFICGCPESLAFKNMTQMATTCSTCYLSSPSIRVRLKLFSHIISQFITTYKLQSIKLQYTTIMETGLCTSETERRWCKEVTHKAINCSRKTLKESRPATARIKFGTWLIKWGSAASTVVYSFFIKLVIFPSATRPAYHQLLAIVIHN